MLAEQTVDFALGAPFFPLEAREEIGIGNVGFVGRVIELFIENHLQLIDEFLLAAHQFGKAVNIVGHEEGVVPSRTFMETGHRLEVFALARIEGGEEGAVGIERTQSAALF